jgi:hypothetical protein
MPFGTKQRKGYDMKRLLVLILGAGLVAGLVPSR